MLTVRRVEGDGPVRVVIDTDRGWAPTSAAFQTSPAPTLLFCGEDLGDGAHGAAAEGAASATDGGLDSTRCSMRWPSADLPAVF